MKTPEEIIKILKSIDNLVLDKDGCLEVFTNKGSHGEVITSFIPGSFTRELLTLIELEMNGELEENVANKYSEI